MLDRVNVALYFFGLRVMRVADLDKVAAICEENLSLRGDIDEANGRIAYLVSALQSIRHVLTANSERCLHCQARAFDKHSRVCPFKIATGAVAEVTCAQGVSEREMN